ncbi:hypothetical protein HAX54_023971 [Datura stramonium]|uniref:Uncharacterized protein n=1 Tax=Datura stramonium TaxID=4076 RepID=A0ABS8S516_DATST|nr:hypothetical protein [Datura stramonium]
MNSRLFSRGVLLLWICRRQLVPDRNLTDSKGNIFKVTPADLSAAELSLHPAKTSYKSFSSIATAGTNINLISLLTVTDPGVFHWERRSAKGFQNLCKSFAIKDTKKISSYHDKSSIDLSVEEDTLKDVLPVASAPSKLALLKFALVTLAKEKSAPLRSHQKDQPLLDRRPEEASSGSEAKKSEAGNRARKLALEIDSIKRLNHFSASQLIFRETCGVAGRENEKKLGGDSEDLDLENNTNER